MRSDFYALLDQLSTQPVIIEAANGALTLTQPLFAAKVEDMTREAGKAAGLPRLIHKAYTEGDWQAFASAPYGTWANTIMSFSIQCNEAWATFSPEDTSRLGQGSYLLEWNLFRATQYTLLCKYLPSGVNPEGDSQQPFSLVPVLLFNGELDPITPPANVALAMDIWPNSLALTLPGQGHSIDRPVWNCILQIMSQFLDDGSVANLSTDCLKDIHPPTFQTYP